MNQPQRRISGMRFICSPKLLISFTLCLSAAVLASCALTPTENRSQPAPQLIRSSVEPPRLSDQFHRDFPGLQNVVAFHDGYYSGSVPKGTPGFESLARLGVKTIISVDGAVPDVASAQAHGMRYIHLPIGYSGFDESRMLQLARASRDAMTIGPVYVHCHHGKHRSAGAAGTVAVVLGWATPDAMIERMKVSGTSPDYDGLYTATASASPVSMAVLDDIPADFPSVSRPADIVKAMVDIDEAMEHLRAIEGAGWTVPNNHPDLVPAAEAGRLADLLRFLDGDHHGQENQVEFTSLMRASRDSAQRLEDMIAAGESDAARLSDQLGIIAASCKDCHSKYRD